MANAKIDIILGPLHFVGEGEQEWVASQLDKLLAQSQTLGKLNNGPDTNGHPAPPTEGVTQVGPLASFLSAKSATSNQVKKFLATAFWLMQKGKQRLGTSDVARALKDNHQTRLGNPSDCLNQNVRKGFCEKDGSEFFITAEGREHLGIPIT